MSLFGITLGVGLGLGMELKLCIWYRGILSVGYLPSPELFLPRFLKVFLASELAQLTRLSWLLTQLWAFVVKAEYGTLALLPVKHRLAMTPEGKGPPCPVRRALALEVGLLWGSGLSCLLVCQLRNLLIAQWAYV